MVMFAQIKPLTVAASATVAALSVGAIMYVVFSSGKLPTGSGTAEKKAMAEPQLSETGQNYSTRSFDESFPTSGGQQMQPRW